MIRDMILILWSLLHSALILMSLLLLLMVWVTQLYQRWMSHRKESRHQRG